MKKQISKSVSIPELSQLNQEMSPEDKIFADKSMEIANYIYYLMEQNGYKQKDLARLMDKTEAEISKWLAGLHNYTLKSLAKIEAALGDTIICTPSKARTAIVYKPVAEVAMEKELLATSYVVNYTEKKTLISENNGQLFAIPSAA